MKYKVAEELGLYVGLEKPEEFVLNVYIHALNLFTYDETEKELKELREDSLKKGIIFSDICGHPITHKNKEELCKFCTNISKLMKVNNEV